MASRYSFSRGVARGRVTGGGRNGYDGMQQQPYRIGVPNDQNGNPAREAPPVYGGKLTPAHDWSEFDDAFARHGSGGNAPAPAAGVNPGAASPEISAAIASGSPLALAKAYQKVYGSVPQSFKPAVQAELESKRLGKGTTTGPDGKLYTDEKTLEGKGAEGDKAILDGLFNQTGTGNGHDPFGVTTNHAGPNLQVGGAGISTTVPSQSGPRNVAVSPNARQAATLLTGVDPATVSPEQRTQNLRDAAGQPRPVDPSTGSTRYVAPTDDAYATRGLTDRSGAVLDAQGNPQIERPNVNDQINSQQPSVISTHSATPTAPPAPTVDTRPPAPTPSGPPAPVASQQAAAPALDHFVLNGQGPTPGSVGTAQPQDAYAKSDANNFSRGGPDYLKDDEENQYA